MKELSTLSEVKQKAYEQLKEQLWSKIGKGFVPNIKAIEKEVRKLKKGIKTLEEGAPLYATDLDEVEKVNRGIAIREGWLQAYNEILDKYYSNIKEQ